MNISSELLFIPNFNLTNSQIALCIFAIVLTIPSEIFCAIIIGILFYYKVDFSNAYFTFIKTLGFNSCVGVLISSYNTLVILFPNLFNVTLSLVLRALNIGLMFNDLLLHTLIAYNRFIAIVFFMKYKQIFTLQKSYILAGTASLLTISYILAFDVFKVPYELVIFLLTVICSIFIMIILYTVTLIIAYKRHKSTTIANADFKSEVKLLVQAILTTTWLFIVIILTFATDKIAPPESVTPIEHIIATSSVALVFITYIISGSLLRKHFVKFCKSLKLCKTTAVSPAI